MQRCHLSNILVGSSLNYVDSNCQCSPRPSGPKDSESCGGSELRRLAKTWVKLCSRDVFWRLFLFGKKNSLKKGFTKRYVNLVTTKALTKPRTIPAVATARQTKPTKISKLLLAWTFFWLNMAKLHISWHTHAERLLPALSLSFGSSWSCWELRAGPPSAVFSSANDIPRRENLTSFEHGEWWGMVERCWVLLCCCVVFFWAHAEEGIKETSATELCQVPQWSVCA